MGPFGTKRQSCRESFWALLLAGAGRSDVNALNKGGLQCDVELLQGLQHSDQGIDECVVFDQCHVLIHVCGDGAVGQQGNPVVQEVISGRVGGSGPGRSKGGKRKKNRTRPRGILELSLKMKKLAPPHSPTSLLKELALYWDLLSLEQPTQLPLSPASPSTSFISPDNLSTHQLLG